MNLSQGILLFVILAPGVVFGVLAFLWFLGWVPGERAVSRLTGVTFSACALGLAALLWKLALGSDSVVAVTFGNWFAVHEYHFPLVLMADRLSLPFLAMTVMLSGLIGQFSATYLHREPGYFRFFVLLHLFAFGSLLAFAAGSFDLLAAGWELVGITSVLLIAFFQLRPAPVENGLRVFAIYRACDIGLFVGIFALHHWAGTASLQDGLPMLTSPLSV
jgi:NADH:ubiquinone oxidoreductase subunit 5 (subunit L)/multisubunit Na+/H+ antiporter MnhA subunit